MNSFSNIIYKLRLATLLTSAKGHELIYWTSLTPDTINGKGITGTHKGDA